MGKRWDLGVKESGEDLGVKGGGWGSELFPQCCRRDKRSETGVGTTGSFDVRRNGIVESRDGQVGR